MSSTLATRSFPATLPQRRHQGSRKHLVDLAFAVGPMLAILAAWEIVARLEIIHPALFPRVTTIVETAIRQLTAGPFLLDIEMSWFRLIVAMIFAILVGTGFGLLIGTNHLVERLAITPLNFFLAIPGIAVFPIVILWFGLSEQAIIIALAFEASLTIVVNTWSGVKSVDQSLLNAARAMCAGGPTLFLRVLFPAALPSIMTGYRLGFARAWRILIAGEMLAAAGTGLGFRIFEARNVLDSETMYAGVLLIGIFGIAIERGLLRTLETRTVTRWGVVRELR